jgi:lantibiotic transport system ATP-binding protein
MLQNTPKANGFVSRMIYLVRLTAMNENLLIETASLDYHFSSTQKTLDNINLRVEKGSIYGFLGPNGAGKTTTLRLVLGLLKNQHGSIKVFGDEFNKNRIAILKRVGSLIEQPSLYGHLTAKENLEVYRKIYKTPKSRINEVLHLVDLAATGKKKAKEFSLGMKQRLSIALALMHKPELLILDEPTNGLDPNGIIETRELIKRLNREENVTIIVSSHILAEVEKMATHVGIIHHGKLLFQGTLKELQQVKTDQSFLQLDTSDNNYAETLLADYGPLQKNGLLLLPFRGRGTTAAINKRLVEKNIDVFLLQPQQNDLEQLFIDITTDKS